MSRKFRKKPVVIDAILAGEVLDGASSGRFSWKAKDPIADWIKAAYDNRVIGFEKDAVLINTEGHGMVRAERTDWIIRGVSGELYPCRPDVFEKTYEAVDETMIVEGKGVSQ
jgi:hypothetical protein